MPMSVSHAKNRPHVTPNDAEAGCIARRTPIQIDRYVHSFGTTLSEGQKTS